MVADRAVGGDSEEKVGEMTLSRAKTLNMAATDLFPIGGFRWFSIRCKNFEGAPRQLKRERET